MHSRPIGGRLCNKADRGGDVARPAVAGTARPGQTRLDPMSTAQRGRTMTAADPPPAAEAPSAADAPRKRSGGPRTPEGKERSRRSALRHGLRAEVLLPDELVERVARRAEEMAAELKPETPYQHWLVGRAARASVQI